jgi:hypothetical protein
MPFVARAAGPRTRRLAARRVTESGVPALPSSSVRRIACPRRLAWPCPDAATPARAATSGTAVGPPCISPSDGAAASRRGASPCNRPATGPAAHRAVGRDTDRDGTDQSALLRLVLWEQLPSRQKRRQRRHDVLQREAADRVPLALDFLAVRLNFPVRIAGRALQRLQLPLHIL